MSATSAPPAHPDSFKSRSTLSIAGQEHMRRRNPHTARQKPLQIGSPLPSHANVPGDNPFVGPERGAGNDVRSGKSSRRSHKKLTTRYGVTLGHGKTFL